MTGRLDDVPLEEPLQVIGKRLGRGITVLGHLLEALQADGLELSGNVGDELVRGHRITLENLDDGLHHARGAERRPAAQELVEDGPQAVHVGRGPDRLAVARGLLRGHVAGRAQDRPGGGQRAVLGGPPRQAEIGDLRLAVAVDQDVRGLEVAMEEPLAVCVVECASQGGNQPGRGSRIAHVGGPLLGQVPSVNELHAEEEHAVLVADLVDRHDVGVVQLAGQLGLAAKPCPLVGRRQRAGEDHLERDDPVQRDLPGLVDNPHPAPGDLLEQNDNLPGVPRPEGLTRGPGSIPVHQPRWRPDRSMVADSQGTVGGEPEKPRSASRNVAWIARIEVREPGQVLVRARVLASSRSKLDLQGKQLAKECAPVIARA